MKTGTDRILTTHVGSLPRPADLLDADQGKGRRPAGRREGARRARSRRPSTNASSEQADIGIDVISDGEMSASRASSPTSSSGSAASRSTSEPSANPWAGSRENNTVSGILCVGGLARPQPGGGGEARGLHRPGHLQGAGAAAADIDDLKAALAKAPRSRRRSCRRSRRRTSRTGQRTSTTRRTRSTCSPSPTRCARNTRRSSMPGFLLQIDDPRLVTYYVIDARPDARRVPQMGRGAGRGAQPRAARACPPDRIRFHTCYSINMGPRVHDMELKDIIDIMLKIKRRRLFVRGRQPAPRARMEGVEERQAARGQGADPRRHHAIRPCWSSIPSWCAERILRASPRWSAASTSSPAPTAASRTFAGSNDDPSDHRLGQARGAGGGRPAGERAALGPRGGVMAPSFRPSNPGRSPTRITHFGGPTHA